jgi:hypothetical protein
MVLKLTEQVSQLNTKISQHGSPQWGSPNLTLAPAKPGGENDTFEGHSESL